MRGKQDHIEVITSKKLAPDILLFVISKVKHLRRFYLDYHLVVRSVQLSASDILSRNESQTSSFHAVHFEDQLSDWCVTSEMVVDVDRLLC